MFKKKVAVAAFAALSVAAMNASAADQPSQNARDLKDHSCKDLMRLSGQDRDVALALAHGYVLGKKGTTKYEIDKLAQITDKFIDHCLDNPKDNAMAAFEKIAK
ncbi:HdeA/HdeB family chaperone [uncultured Piscinibacter sp.]|uniref:HdeA/HdeB family chaperone n=1 Tax=uncultured Piscinibacter sp. TaxID=1131835 RepID=UPI00262EAA68|nr:HdeA/HdeB family chaperone [uncultured Piscinibacter sp.]